MSRFLSALMIIPLLGGPRAIGADDPAPRPTSRVVEGRILDDQGRPAQKARVMFSPVSPPVPPTERSTARTDDSGRFRIELVDFAPEAGPVPASGPIRYLALAPGFRPVVGKVEAGLGPLNLEIPLKAEPWKTTEIRLIDRDGRPVEKAEVSWTTGGNVVWDQSRTDSDGRSLVSMAAGQVLSITIRHDRYLPTAFSLRGVADDPSRFTISLHDPIRGRVVDSSGKPLPGIQIGRSLSIDMTSDESYAQGRLRLYPLIGSKEPATTDQEGRFALFPMIRLDIRSIDRSGSFRARPQTLCFADESLRKLAFLSVDLNRSEPLTRSRSSRPERSGFRSIMKSRSLRVGSNRGIS